MRAAVSPRMASTIVEAAAAISSWPARILARRHTPSHRTLRTTTTAPAARQDFAVTLLPEYSPERRRQAGPPRFTSGTDQGDGPGHTNSVEAVRHIVSTEPAPPGAKAYVTGAAATTTDQNAVGDASMKMIEGLTFVVIIVMLLLVYRSVVTVLVTMSMVVVGLLSAAASSPSSASTTSSS